MTANQSSLILAWFVAFAVAAGVLCGWALTSCVGAL
jgi:hypothetical protein